jgi:hypothetical protein
MVLDANSTPRVGSWSFLKVPSTYRERKHDLPTSDYADGCTGISDNDVLEEKVVVILSVH